MWFHVLAASLLATAWAAPASAQDLLTVRKTLTSTAARALVDSCVAYATAHKQTVAAAVVDSAGILLEFHAMQGSTVTNIESAPLKARASVRWRRSTQSLGERVRSGENQAPVWLGDLPQRGAVPIVVDGEVVGAMGIGGAASDDCAIQAIKSVFAGKALTELP